MTTPPLFPSTLLRPLAAALCAIATAFPAIAQPATAPSRPQNRNQDRQPESVPAPAMQDEPYTIHELGVRLLLPTGTTVRTERAGNTVVATFAPPSMNGLVVVQSKQVTDPAVTIEQVGDSYIEQIRRAGGRTMTRMKNLFVGDQSVDRFYLSTGQSALGSNSSQIRGYTVFKPEEDRFVIVELVTDQDEFTKARPVYETIVATVTFADPDQLSATRRSRLLAGQTMREGLDSADFAAAIEANADRWERLYKPAPGGSVADAEEIGYRHIEAWRGMRGEMDPNKSKGRFNATERTEGYLIRLTARVIFNEQIIDTRSVMFVSLDDEEEAWRVDMRLRPPPRVQQEPRQFTEFGTRENGHIDVRVESSHDVPTRVETDLPDMGYMSRVEEILLPQFLASAGVETDFAFYTYRSDAQSLTIRHDSLEKVEAASPSWKITSRLTENEDPYTTTLTNDGRPLRVTFSDGRLWAPVEREQLLRLWRSKNLPLD